MERSRSVNTNHKRIYSFWEIHPIDVNLSVISLHRISSTDISQMMITEIQ